MYLLAERFSSKFIFLVKNSKTLGCAFVKDFITLLYKKSFGSFVEIKSIQLVIFHLRLLNKSFKVFLCNWFLI